MTNRNKLSQKFRNQNTPFLDQIHILTTWKKAKLLLRPVLRLLPQTP